MSQVIDFDLNAAIDGTGQLKELTNEEALNEALRFFISVKLGNVLGFPEEGGILDSTSFSTMSPDYLDLISFRLRNAITNEFEPEIILDEISIVPDYENRILEIEIRYTNPLTEVPNSLIVYTTDPQETVRNSLRIDISYIGENLFNFCLANKDKYPEERMVFNADKDIFEWGQYDFLYLTSSDPYFEQILNLING
jgi:hypothetical protein